MAMSCGAPGQISQIQVIGSWWGDSPSMAAACRRQVKANSPALQMKDVAPTFFGQGELGADEAGFYRTRTHRAYTLRGVGN